MGRYSLADIIFKKDGAQRCVLSRFEDQDEVIEDLNRRFGSGNFRVAANGILAKMPEVGDPTMEHIYDLLESHLKESGSVADLLTLMFGYSVEFGLAIYEHRKSLASGAGDKDSGSSN